MWVLSTKSWSGRQHFPWLYIADSYYSKKYIWRHKIHPNFCPSPTSSRVRRPSLSHNNLNPGLLPSIRLNAHHRPPRTQHLVMIPRLHFSILIPRSRLQEKRRIHAYWTTIPTRWQDYRWKNEKTRSRPGAPWNGPRWGRRNQPRKIRKPRGRWKWSEANRSLSSN